MDPWSISAPERAKHVEQFQALQPNNGFITGDQAKGFLIQSGLPGQTLAQIWGLADADADGKLNFNEFSVACKLVTMKLRGFEVPSSIPPSLTIPRSIGASPITSPMQQPQPQQINNMMMPQQQQQQLPPNVAMMSQPTMMPIQSSTMPTMPVTMAPLIPGQMQQQPQQIMPAGMVPTAISMAGVGVGLPNQNQIQAQNITNQPPQSLPLQQQQQQINRTMPLTQSSKSISQDSIKSPPQINPSLMEWSIPQPSRLKFTQFFNQLDKGKTGFLTGQQARNVLIQSGLNQMVLAQIWGLSDLDADGRLTNDEFVLAMHLIELAKVGKILPQKLPMDLIPPSFRRKMSVSTVGQITPTSDNIGSQIDNRSSAASVTSPPPGGIQSPLSITSPQSITSPTSSFDEKRKENFNKGENELQLRRKILLDEEQRLKDERARREREEFEKQEKARLEAERKKQMEIENQLKIQREMEERRMEEMRKSEELKEQARREMERKRMEEMQDTKLQELSLVRQKGLDEVLKLKGVNSTMILEIEEYQSKVKNYSSKITETRQGVSNIKSEIDKMRSKRDSFMNEMNTLKASLKDMNTRILSSQHEKLKLEKQSKESEVKQLNLKSLREKLELARTEIDKKKGETEANDKELCDLRDEFVKTLDECRELYSKEFKSQRDTIVEKRRKYNTEFDYNAAWGGGEAPKEVSVNGTHEPCVYYRALYDFEGRNHDELSFITGQIIQQNPDLEADPGWLSGMYDDGSGNHLSGWFPETFVEVISEHEAMALGGGEVGISEQQEDQSVPVPVAAEQSGVPHIVLYEYTSEEHGDLTFGIGEIVYVTKSDGEWWTGYVDENRVGIFPASYLEPEPYNMTYTDSSNIVNADVTTTTTGAKVDSNSTNKYQLNEQEEYEIKREMQEIQQQNTKGLSRKSSLKSSMKKKYEIATVLANYTGTSEGQLNLTRGQLIIVRKKSSSGWWEGELQAKGKKRQLGWFPGSYVKILGPGSGSRTSSSRTTPIPFDRETEPSYIPPIYQMDNDNSPAKSPKPPPPQEQEEEQKFEPKFEQKSFSPVNVSSSNTNEEKAFEPITTNSNTTRIEDDQRVVDEEPEPVVELVKNMRVIALYPYSAQNSDELTFVKDDIIEVISKDEPDWWRGRFVAKDSVNGSHIGLFPTNYVQQINPEEGKTSSASASVEKEDSLDLTFRTPPAPVPSSSSSISLGYGYSASASTSNNLDFMPALNTSERAESIRELIDTEVNYMQDMIVVKDGFMDPLYRSGILNNNELNIIFINWNELIDCSDRLLKAFSIRKMNSPNKEITIIGDILCQLMPAMKTYIRFCSAQLRSAAIIQELNEKNQDFKNFCIRCQKENKMNLPLSSFLIKPMQRITKYPLLIKNIKKYTPESHPDFQTLEEAFLLTQELCQQVNEGVREIENSQNLEWLQDHIQNPQEFIKEERLIFNSLTNKVGPRRLIHSTIVKKTKSGKELALFLFNDFLMLTTPSKPLNSNQFNFDRYRNLSLKIYRKPIFLNVLSIVVQGAPNVGDEVLGENDLCLVIDDASTGQPIPSKIFITTSSATEKKLIGNKITDAKKKYFLIEKQMLQKQKSKKAHQGVGRVLVTVMEGVNLRCISKTVYFRPVKGILRVQVMEGNHLATRDISKGKSDPYCEVSLGSETKKTRTIQANLNPKWNDSMQFSVKDLNDDILCVTVYDRDYFSPDQFMGRCEINISQIHEMTRTTKTPWINKFTLHEIETGEILIKLHLQIFCDN